MTCTICNDTAPRTNGACSCARDVSALVDTMQSAARSIDPHHGANPANVAEIFRIAHRYNAAMAAVDSIARLNT